MFLFFFTENVGRRWCYDIIRMSRPQWGVWSRWRRGCHSADAGVVASWLRSLRWTPASSFMYSGGESVSPAYVLILLSSLWFSSSFLGFIQRASLTSKDHPEILPCGDVLFLYTSFLTFFFLSWTHSQCEICCYTLFVAGDLPNFRNNKYRFFS